MDKERGACVFKQHALQEVVENALRHFDGTRYILDDYVIMPNHVHVLFKPGIDWSHSKTLHSWKSFTSVEINKALNQTGTFWMDENFDHLVRSEEQLLHYRRYIKNNPAKARLAQGAFRLGKGLGLDVN